MKLSLALVPKCPLCWAAWAGVGAALGFDRLGFRPWLPTALAVVLGTLLTFVAWRAVRQRRPAIAVLALVGGFLTITGRLVFEHPPTLWIGIALLAALALGPGRRLSRFGSWKLRPAFGRRNRKPALRMLRRARRSPFSLRR